MIIKERKTMYVTFDFGGYGSGAYVGVDIYEGKTIEECLKIRSEYIDGAYINGEYVTIN